MQSSEAAKRQLDVVINKSRVHFYKPFQIAEILRKHREEGSFDLNDVEAYRNASKNWRDEVSRELVGRICTSSQKFQDNIFEANAMSPAALAKLGEINEQGGQEGVVEAYIYSAFQQKMGVLNDLKEYLKNATAENFDLNEFIAGFRRDAGLRRSIDKVYEICVYALFSALVRYLNATVTIQIPDGQKDLLEEFEDFTEIVLGLTKDENSKTVAAKLYRVGVANAADRGLDMWANFGPAVQIKHLSLTEELAEDIVHQVAADRIVIVCQSAEQAMITRILTQLGISERVQGVITQDDLQRWYERCFSEEHKDSVGKTLLADLYREYINEFPAVGVIVDFMTRRGYDKVEGDSF
ncbi:MAG TPA: HaeII family restriction endonuclease [Phycisphaerales bacterium]|nr:HaeII family restriction endonuclease [Phycisphaerales bacterium]